MTGILQAILSFFGVAPAAAANYIEDVFSTYLYTGNDSTQTITNGIDLSGKGGLVWCKGRASGNHSAWDTARGVKNLLIPNDIAANLNIPVAYPAYPDYGLQTFNSNGFTLGKNWEGENIASGSMVSWTFRKQAKFFDVVTYTGNGSNRTIAHNLGSVPGCIIVKRTDTTGAWQVYHRSLANTEYLVLNTTAAKATGTTRWNSTTPTSTEFSLGTDTTVNANSGTYVAYLFAHDAGGFGATGADNVISCGSYTGNGSATGPTINLGWEPQWLLVKPSTVVDNWNIIDNMRGATVSGSNLLYANAANAEGGVAANIAINATGFQPNTTNSGVNGNGQTYIYIAIRRGPMKTPTSGTSVFTPTTYTGNGTSQTESAGFPTDMAIITNRGASGGYERNVGDRLRGGNRTLFTTLTVAENTATNRITAFDNMVGVAVGSDGDVNLSSGSQIAWNFRRAPGFFDEVCYTGTAAAQTQSHNLGVAPELMIVKRRSAAASWAVYSSALGNTKSLELNSTGAVINSVDLWNSTTPTSSVFSIGGSDTSVNASGSTYVAYLFATVAGVSKVGSYTGTGTTLQVDCGFTAGSRFVMIKRTDSTGDWYVWDSARGIVAGNDPYLLMNSTAAEVTNTDYVDTYNAGFEISSTAPAAINASGGTFIFLAIA